VKTFLRTTSCSAYGISYPASGPPLTTCADPIWRSCRRDERGGPGQSRGEGLDQQPRACKAMIQSIRSDYIVQTMQEFRIFYRSVLGRWGIRRGVVEGSFGAIGKHLGPGGKCGFPLVFQYFLRFIKGQEGGDEAPRRHPETLWESPGNRLTAPGRPSGPPKSQRYKDPGSTVLNTVRSAAEGVKGEEVELMVDERLEVDRVDVPWRAAVVGALLLTIGPAGLCRLDCGRQRKMQ